MARNNGDKTGSLGPGVRLLCWRAFSTVPTFKPTDTEEAGRSNFVGRRTGSLVLAGARRGFT